MDISLSRHGGPVLTAKIDERCALTGRSPLDRTDKDSMIAAVANIGYTTLKDRQRGPQARNAVAPGLKVSGRELVGRGCRKSFRDVLLTLVENVDNK